VRRRSSKVDPASEAAHRLGGGIGVGGGGGSAAGEESAPGFLCFRGGREGEKEEEEPRPVHGGMKRARDDATGSQLKRPNLARSDP
jgi:hypothetical protein